MFAYCLNNPVVLEDISGTVARVSISANSQIDETPWRDFSLGGGGVPAGRRFIQRAYIRDQNATGVGELKLGWSTVSHGGCGVVAAYNALITLGSSESFESVLRYFNQKSDRLVAFGFLGMLPSDIVEYFECKGYHVFVTSDLDGMNACSQTADACIMWYAWPETYAGIFDAFGAHFVHYRKTAYNYVAYNVGITGTSSFGKPSSFGGLDNCFYAVGIFIYK